jgi:lipoprotein-releasing system ATP-binding protein
MGMVFQGYFLLPELTALENVFLPGMIGRRSTTKAAEDSLQAVGLADRMQHLPPELSGGEQQRVALARALITKPKILLADEPTGDLDGRTAEAVFALIARLHRDYQLTSLIATHNLAFARRCHRVLRLHQGRVEEIVPESLPA